MTMNIESRGSTPSMLPAEAASRGAQVDEGAFVAFAGGSPEAALAEALLQLEESRDRDQILQGEAHRNRLTQMHEALENKRSAARSELVAGLLSGVAELAEGAAAGVEGTAAKRGWKYAFDAVEGAAKTTAPGFNFRQKRKKNDAEANEIHAVSYEAARTQAAEGRRQSDRAAENVLQGIKDIQRLRHEATLAALRG
ncbi:MAG: hypothetical protein H5U40_04615 [Polyangiaceae bacterium]|nr:hypothetical protein [Polyangiaceae bacterium]